MFYFSALRRGVKAALVAQIMLLLSLSLASCGSSETGATLAAARYQTDESLDVAVLDDAGSPTGQTLDLYFPVLEGNTTDGRPLLVLVHGGGFDSGSTLDFQEAARRFAGSGYVAVVPSYELSPAASTESASGILDMDKVLNALNKSVDDVREALNFVDRFKNKYGVDTSTVGVIGISAGGATSLAIESTDSRLVPLNNEIGIEAIVGFSTMLGPPLWPAIPEGPAPVRIVNYEVDTASTPVAYDATDTIAEFQAKGGEASIEFIPGSGHDQRIIDNLPLFEDFLLEHVELTSTQ